MNKLSKALISTFFISSTLFAVQNNMQNMQDYRSVKSNEAQILQDGKNKNYCPICGMTLSKFYKTNHAATAHNHTKQYCSIHCAVEDKEINKTNLTNFKVVDNKTLKFIDSKNAYFVVGSNMPATMSMISKYAFSTKEEAQSFAQKNGGEIKTFEEVYNSVKANIKMEMAKVSKKQAMAAKKGSKIYSKLCKPTNQKFSNTADAKTFILENNMCERLNEKQLQMVGLFLAGK